jgi:lipopolysaccharide transport system ATP-binding protein
MSDVTIRVEGLGKRYRFGRHVGTYGRLTESLWNSITAPFSRHGDQRTEQHGHIWALRDLSLEIEQGDVVGVVGRNGAGKTTFLKVLSRITEPTEGRAEIRGRVGSLLEVGTGFHPELTGAENIFLNGAILGMKRAEIRRKFDEIVEFAEVQQFIDTPVKRFSSGMYVRLAFAVAAYLEPEVLIIDEVLAVGDVAFQKKSLGKIGDVARTGRTVLFVSHNLGAVAELCTRAVLLDQGKARSSGDVGAVLTDYSDLIASGRSSLELEPVAALPSSVLSVTLTDGSGTPSASFDIADEIQVTVKYEVREQLHGLQHSLTLFRNMIPLARTFDTDEREEPLFTVAPGSYEARCTIPPMFLKAGFYTLALDAGTPERQFQELEGAASFEVEERTVNTHSRGYRRDRPGNIIFPGTWHTSRVP